MQWDVGELQRKGAGSAKRDRAPYGRRPEPPPVLISTARNAEVEGDGKPCSSERESLLYELEELIRVMQQEESGRLLP